MENSFPKCAGSFSKKVYITFVGCQKENLDTARIRIFFEKNGWAIVKDIRDACLAYVGTCAFTEFMELASLNCVEALLKRNPAIKIIVGGCVSAISTNPILSSSRIKVINPQTIDTIDDLVGNVEYNFDSIRRSTVNLHYQVGFHESLRARLKRYVCEFGFSGGIWRVYQIMESKKAKRQRSAGSSHKQFSNETYLLEISRGCVGQCSYCAIRFARGKLQSRNLSEIINEFKNAVDQGYRSFRLIASDSGCYGVDIQRTFPELLDALCKIEGDNAIYIEAFNPRWLVNYFDTLLPILVKYQDRLDIHIPIQSASERILGLMKRGYHIEDVERCLLALKLSAPRLKVSSAVIVGFPGETNEDFLKTKRFIMNLNFVYVLIFKYSKRPHTETSSFKNDVWGVTKLMRMWHLELFQTIIVLTYLMRKLLNKYMSSGSSKRHNIL